MSHPIWMAKKFLPKCLPSTSSYTQTHSHKQNILVECLVATMFLLSDFHTKYHISEPPSASVALHFASFNAAASAVVYSVTYCRRTCRYARRAAEPPQLPAIHSTLSLLLSQFRTKFSQTMHTRTHTQTHILVSTCVPLHAP